MWAFRHVWCLLSGCMTTKKNRMLLKQPNDFSPNNLVLREVFLHLHCGYSLVDSIPHGSYAAQLCVYIHERFFKVIFSWRKCRVWTERSESMVESVPLNNAGWLNSEWVKLLSPRYKCTPFHFPIPLHLNAKWVFWLESVLWMEDTRGEEAEWR